MSTERVDLEPDPREGDWLEANRAQWDERVPVHVASEFYDQTALREGRGRLYRIEEAELASLYPEGLEGLRVLHLQCHFGADSLVLAQRGASVVGLDFSRPAIDQARALASEVGLADRARFVHANVYDARHMLPEPESFDLVFTTWGTITWLPDIVEWARIVAWFLKPGGRLYFADNHPAAQVFDGADAATGLPVFSYPYSHPGQAIVAEDGADYATDAVLQQTRSFEWQHPLGEVVEALLDAGLRLEFLREHYEVPWRMHEALVDRGEGMWGWPAERWLPLSVSIAARAPRD